MYTEDQTMNERHPAEHEDTANVIALPPLLFCGPLALGLLLHTMRPVTFVPRALARVVGPALIAMALLIGASAFATLRRAGTPPDPREATTTMVVEGPYRVTRNPIYLAFTLLYAGITVLVNALWAALLLPFVLAIMRRGVIDREERYLERRFGDDHLRYKARVRRWI
jgi:protein-S-isoprenylcysteine O-methyltransferase Ste14